MDKYSNPRKVRVDIPAKSTATVSFNDTKPNYFLIANPSAASLYMAAGNLPSVTNFDCMIAPSTNKLQAYVLGYTQVYLYNDSMAAVTVQLTSFEWEFDPSILALGEIKVEMSGITFPDTMSVNLYSFGAPLPAGGNTIGSVNLANPLFTDAEGDTILLNLAKLPNIETKLGEVKAAIQAQGGIVRQQLLEQTVNAGTPYSVSGVYGIGFLKNDGTANLTVALGTPNGGAFSLKPGESVDSLRWAEATTVTLTSSSGAIPVRGCYEMRG